MVDNQCHHQIPPLSTSNATRIHTLRPSPIHENKKKKKAKVIVEQKGSKKIKIEKLVEVEEEDSKEEGGRKGRIRLGRVSQSQVRHKQKANRFRVEEVEEENSKNNEREREEENNSNSKREKGKEEVEKSENFVDNSIDNAQMFVGNTQVLAGNAITTETTHVSASFTLQPITCCEDSRKVDTSPITISSLVKEKSKVFTNPKVLQDDNQAEKAKEEVKKVGLKTKRRLRTKRRQLPNWIKGLKI